MSSDPNSGYTSGLQWVNDDSVPSGGYWQMVSADPGFPDATPGQIWSGSGVAFVDKAEYVAAVTGTWPNGVAYNPGMWNGYSDSHSMALLTPTADKRTVHYVKGVAQYLTDANGNFYDLQGNPQTSTGTGTGVGTGYGGGSSGGGSVASAKVYTPVVLPNGDTMTFDQNTGLWTSSGINGAKTYQITSNSTGTWAINTQNPADSFQVPGTTPPTVSVNGISGVTPDTAATVTQQGIDTRTQAQTAANTLAQTALQYQQTYGLDYASALALAQQNQYNTQAGIYTGQQTNFKDALTAAGQLSATQQGQYDTRTQDMIKLAAAPGDFVQKEYATRALAAPTATVGPAYRDVPQLSTAINQLQSWQPTTGPTSSPSSAPAAPSVPGAFANAATPGGTPANPGPVKTQTPTTYTNSSGVMGQFGNVAPLDVSSGFADNQPAGVDPTLAAADQQTTQAAYNLPSTSTAEQQKAAADAANANTMAMFNQQLATNNGTTPAKAQGTDGFVKASKMIIGDPQANGQPNPEFVEYKNDKVRVTPLQDIAKAYGTTTGLDMYANGTRGVLDRSVIPMAKGTVKGKLKKGKNGRAQAARQMKGKIFKFAAGTQGLTPTGAADPNAPTFYTDSSGAPNALTPTYGDSAYQQLPSLQYLQGGMDRQQYNTQTPTLQAGAFGTALPTAGGMNYGRYMDIQRDPVSKALMDSLYNSASMNYEGEGAKAAYRAPIGNASFSSAIRT